MKLSVGAAVWLTFQLLPALSPAMAQTRQAYFGGYTPPSDPAKVGNNAEGISLADVDGQTGRITNVRLVARSMSPSWITLSADRRFLYSVNETSEAGPGEASAVSAYAIQPDGGLRLLSIVSSGATGPCYVSLDPSGRFALVANYYGGAFSVFRVGEDGRLGEMTDLVRPDSATASPRGPGASRAHMIAFDPSGRYLLGDDTGRNQIFVWTLNTTTGKLTEVSSTNLPAGTGPRHFVFSPDGKTLYQLMEASSELAAFAFADGRLSKVGQSVSGLPAGWAGTSAASELLISKDGRRLYFANRLHDSIATFATSTSGSVKRIASVHTQGDTPRSLTLDPAGRFLYALNQRSNNVTVYRISRRGTPSFTGDFLRLGTPAVMVFRN